MAMVRFGDVAERVNTKEDRFKTDLVYYVGGEHIETDELRVTGRGVIKEADLGPMFYFGFKPGDILFVTRNPHLRKSAKVDFAGMCSEKTLVIASKDERVLLQDYLAGVMQSDDFWDFMEENKSGSVNYFVNWSTLANYEFDLPPLSRQRELADLLWAANDLKEAYKKTITATDEMLKAKFREYISGVDVEVRPFGELSESLDGRRIPVKSGDRKAGVYPYYGASGVVDYVDSYIFDEEILLVSEDGANLTARTTPIAFSVSGKCWVNNHAHVVTFHEKATQKFVEYYIELTDISPYITGTAQPKLNKEKLNRIPIPLPPLSLQREFVAIANKAESAKANLKKSIAAIDQVMKGLINQ